MMKASSCCQSRGRSKGKGGFKVFWDSVDVEFSDIEPESGTGSGSPVPPLMGSVG